jgi:hypothetical protein
MNDRRFARFFLAFVLTSTVIAQCPPQGLTLTVTGGRLGDPASLQVTGSPFAPGILAFDVAGGPTSTPVGIACLGLTSQLQLFPFTFDSGGILSIQANLPTSPGLDGLTIFMQAIAAQTGQPSPFAWSNGASLTLSSPKLVLIDPGVLTPVGPGTPGKFCVFDALTDTPITPAIPLPAGYVRDAISIPALGLVAMLLTSNTILVIDANTGALVTTITPPTGTAAPGDPTSLAADGISLYVVYEGYVALFPGTSSVPGSVRSYFLPFGTIGPTISLPFGNPREMLVVPGSSVAYLRHHSASGPGSPAPATVLPIDLATGGALPPINFGTGFGTIAEWTLHNGIVYCVSYGIPPWPPQIPFTYSQRALMAFSTITNAPLPPSPVVLPLGSGPGLRLGPGTGGSTSLFHPGPSPAAALLEISPTTLNIVNTIPLGGYLSGMQLSSGGTEWLAVLDTGTQKQLVKLALPTLAPTVLSTLAGYGPYVGQFITPLPSATIRKAYFTENGSSITPFATDPATPPSTALPLPLSNSSYIVLQN